MTMTAATFLRNDRRGSVAVEMALVLPLMLILMFGGLEGGYYLWSEHRVLKAVRDGARYAGRQPFDKFDCTAGTIDPSDTEYTEERIQYMTRTGIVAPSTATPPDGDPGQVNGWTANSTVSVTVACNAAPPAGIYASLPDGAPIVTVSANTAYRSLFLNLGFATSGLGLRATSQAAVMGI